MSVLVTGGSGFIGSALVNFLIQKKINVYVIDNASTDPLETICKNTYNIDISSHNNINQIKTLISDNNIRTVFHMAALPSVQRCIENPILSYQHNLTSTANVLEAMKNTTATQIVFSSSSAVYGDCKILPIHEKHIGRPTTPYALHKLLSEQLIYMYCNLYNIRGVCLRYFNVFGENMKDVGTYSSVINIFKKQKTNNIPLTITGDGLQRRDFVYVKDVVVANYLAATNIKNKFAVYNVSSGRNYSINEIAKKFNHPCLYIDKRLEINNSLGDITSIKKEINWSPTINLLEWLELNN